ncbi:phosphatase PAP2 family protein [Sphingomonas sp. SUN019]|uniref:phosphatase PAP2 family protein n=1 Tax=Sphingomonas sp. SUN019 TaxID=2937788 RepID=UPI002164C218|nr:phosphatase PAP2 family protein [Sphingomonas sp. SUN019]UVO50285.1 phosphatase PAP2 family protein [Sphingomonas sp. SUN019]
MPPLPPITGQRMPHAAAWRLVGAMYAVALALGWWLSFGYDGTDLNPVAAVATFALAIAFLARGRGFGRIAAGIDASVVMLAGSVATAVLTALFATSALPLQDAALARADTLLFGAAWPALHRWMESQPTLSSLLRGAYGTLGWQPFVLVALLAATGRTERLSRLVFGWTFALIVCAAIFPFVAALGPYVHFGFTPASSDLLTAAAPGWHAPQVLAGLRDGSLSTIGAANLTGLVAFPSFHTAGAVLLGWAALALPRPVAAPFVVLNVAMVASTPTVGSHYLVDTAAGLLLAVAAIKVSDRPLDVPARPRAESTGRKSPWLWAGWQRRRKHV